MSPIIEAMKPSPNSDRQSCASLGELFPKNGTAFATESPTTFASSRPTIFGSSRRPGIPIVRRAVIPVAAVVGGGVVTPVVGADVGGLPPLEIGAPIGIAEPSLWPRFVDVDARSISFCRLSRHGQDCSRHHREDAEQGVAELAHS